ncbi:MAG: GPW/gp25 family protein [Cellulosilyticaceae bacterium]
MYEVTGEVKKLNLDARGVEEILQNISIIIATPKYSVPLNRNFGVEVSMLDAPIEIAENIFTAKVIEAIQDFEPRAKVTKVTYFKNHAEGKLIPKVQVVINDVE